jgi:hypothetical protein
MKRTALRLFATAALVCSSVAVAQEKIEDWPAPLHWSPVIGQIEKPESGEVGPASVDAVPTPPLPFVGLTPCRLVDTRGNGFAGAYGPPALTAGVPRSFVLTGRCGISAAAQAVSLNVTVTNTQGPGHIVIYPTGGAQPTVSTLNYVAGQTIANAAVVPLGTGGAITVVAGVSGTDLILDTNGDYRGGVVTSLNGLFGGVNLAPGSNVTITPSGQTLTVAASGGPGGVLPTGTSSETLRHNGTSWVASGALTNDGTDVSVTGSLTLSNGVLLLKKGSFTLFHVCCNFNNTFLGISAGNLASTGSFNTAIGTLALANLTSGASNTAVGENSLVNNTSGSYNTAVGDLTLWKSVGAENTAVGAYALSNNTTGSSNIALGYYAGSTNTGGSGNIYIGNSTGANTTGSNNIYIGNPGSGNESGQIRIGTVANITQGTVIVGIHGFGSGSGIPVIVNSGGRLGTTTSSARFKEDIRSIGTESDDLMKLRPVAFRYRESHEAGRLTQYGLIAEEVAEVYPELVVNDDQGRPLAIRSQLLEPLFLNELQKQRRTIDAQRAEIDELRAAVATLAAGVCEE